MVETINRTFYNHVMDRTSMRRLIGKLVGSCGNVSTASVLDQLKALGFEYATRTGISLGIDDLLASPSKKSLIKDAERQARNAEENYQRGCIHAMEKLRQIVETWHTTSEFLKREMSLSFNTMEPLNPVHMMSFSGARGSISQVHQLVGMRGLMSDPQGRIIDLPIQSNLREGLSILEYIISCYGARKGVVDTAIRTADAGYLTRRLVEVAQHVVVNKIDCHTFRGVYLRSIKSSEEHRYISSEERLLGRVLSRSVYLSNRCIAVRNQDIGARLAKQLTILKNEDILIRSPLICKSNGWACQLCYGWNSNYGRLVQLGEAVGVIAGQSIGEPGTQLTLRTFHTGGVFTGDIANHVRAPSSGIVHFDSGRCESIRNRHGRPGWLSSKPISVTINTTGDFYLSNPRAAKQHILHLPENSLLVVTDNQYIESKQIIAEIRANKPPFKEKVRKHVYSNICGEVVYTSNIGVLNRPKDPLFSHQSLSAIQTGYVWVLATHLLYDLNTHIVSFYNTEDYLEDQAYIALKHYNTNNKCLFIDNTKNSKILSGYKFNLWNYKIKLSANCYGNNAFLSTPHVSNCSGVSYPVSSILEQYAEISHKAILSSKDLIEVRISNLDVYKNNIGQIKSERLIQSQHCNTNGRVNSNLKQNAYIDQVLKRKKYVRSTLRHIAMQIQQMQFCKSGMGIGFIGTPNNLSWLASITKRNIALLCWKTMISIKQMILCSCYDEIFKKKQLRCFNPPEWYGVIMRISSLLTRFFQLPPLGQFVSKGIFVHLKHKLAESGKIICVLKSSIMIRFSQCKLLIAGTRLHFYCYEVINERQSLMTLIYEQLRASDIVQGLPKAEQLLEAGSSNEIVSNLQTNFQNWQHFLFHFSHPYVISSEKSIENTQMDLVDRIQTVYLSQGVRISDKHIEIIVRQMTSKVLFTENIYHLKYNPAFLPGELIELSRARKIGTVLQTFIPYKPILLGITKASINIDSFLAAASFERTSKVLAMSALQHKIDWIKGLQENVLFGGIIPAGTGCKQILFTLRLKEIFIKHSIKSSLFANNIFCSSNTSIISKYVETRVCNGVQNYLAQQVLQEQNKNNEKQSQLKSQLNRIRLLANKKNNKHINKLLREKHTNRYLILNKIGHTEQNV